MYEKYWKHGDREEESQESSHGWKPEEGGHKGRGDKEHGGKNKPQSNASQLSAIMGKIQNRDPFSYDFNADALYNVYKDRYIQQGNLAMQDTMGQAAALTGGYGNSYAQSVGQQTYQGYMQGLNDRIPELYQLALDKYNREGDAMMDQYGMLSAQQQFQLQQDQFNWQKEQAQKEWDWRQMEWDAAHPVDTGGSAGSSSGGSSGGGSPSSKPKPGLSVEEVYMQSKQNGASTAELDSYLKSEIAAGNISSQAATDLRDKRY